MAQQTGLVFHRGWLDAKLPTYRIPDPDEMLKDVEGMLGAPTAASGPGTSHMPRGATGADRPLNRVRSGPTKLVARVRLVAAPSTPDPVLVTGFGPESTGGEMNKCSVPALSSPIACKGWHPGVHLCANLRARHGL